MEWSEGAMVRAITVMLYCEKIEYNSCQYPPSLFHVKNALLVAESFILRKRPKHIINQQMVVETFHDCASLCDSETKKENSG